MHLCQPAVWLLSLKIFQGYLLILQDSVWQVGSIFLSDHGNEDAALISTVPFEDGLTGELAFAPLQIDANESEVSESQNWQVGFLSHLF